MSNIAEEFDFFHYKIKRAIEKNDWKLASDISLQWAQIVECKLGLQSSNNWKEFKVNLCEHYFGKNESRFFCADSSPLDIRNYYLRLLPSKVRFTVHKSDEACHSTSRRIDDFGSIEDVIDLIRSLSYGDIVKIFPESSNDQTICFRRLYEFDNNNVSYEMGFGQAYLVFENERGYHETISLEISHNKIQTIGSNTSLLVAGKQLFDEYESVLQLNSWRLCKYLGVPYVSIEGYYNHVNNLSPSVVDIDLPFDIAFFGGRL